VLKTAIPLVLLATAACGSSQSTLSGAFGGRTLRAPLEVAGGAAPPGLLGLAANESAFYMIDAQAHTTAPEKDALVPVRQPIMSIGKLLDCPEDMIAIYGTPADPEQGIRAAIDGGYCVDRYEAPNERGALPLAFQTAQDGEAWCAARGKHLCSEAQWERACEGAEHRRFPYGATHVRGACNDGKQGVGGVRWSVLSLYPDESATAEAERLYEAEPSGSREACVSEEGAFDMTGNVAEWVVRSFPVAKWGHVIKGCFWAGCFGHKHPSCGFVNGVHPGTFRSYEVGFRCCKAR